MAIRNLLRKEKVRIYEQPVSDDIMCSELLFFYHVSFWQFLFPTTGVDSHFDTHTPAESTSLSSTTWHMDLSLRKIIAIWMSKNYQKLDIFSKKIAKNFHFFSKKLPLEGQLVTSGDHRDLLHQGCQIWHPNWVRLAPNRRQISDFLRTVYVHFGSEDQFP